MKGFRGRVVLILFGLAMVFAWQVPDAQAGCNKYVHYDRRGGSLEFSGFGLSKVKAGLESKSLQVASDLVQLFDAYQESTCRLLDRKKGAPEYEEEVNSSLDATKRLVEMMAVLSTSKGKPDSDALAKIYGSVGIAKDLRARHPERAPSDIRLDDDVKAASPEFAAVVERIQRVSLACAWDRIDQENRDKAAQELRTAAGKLTLPLGIPVPEIRAYVFMPCADNWLHAVPGLSVVGDKLQPESQTITIQLHYGFVGVAFKREETQIGTIPKDGESFSFTMGKHDERISQDRARRILIDPDAMEKSTARWVIAVPLKNQVKQVIGVMSISSDVAREQSQLDSAYDKGKIGDLAEKIALLLVTGTSKRPTERKN